jgi:DNA adenine methylase
VKWAGGKRSLLSDLIPLAPPSFNRYIEPFLGGASMFLALSPTTALLGDFNPDLVQFYEAVRDDPRAVMCQLDKLQPHVEDAAFYYRTRAGDAATLSAAARAARFLFLNKTGYNGLYRVNKAGAFNVPFGQRPAPPKLYERANLNAVATALRGARLRHGDFEPLLDEAGDGDFVYVDPPYAPLSPTSNFTSYTRESFTELDQRRLADAVHRAAGRGARVLVSNSDAPLIRVLYTQDLVHPIKAHRRINSDPAGRAKITELAIQVFCAPVGAPERASAEGS